MAPTRVLGSSAGCVPAFEFGVEFLGNHLHPWMGGLVRASLCCSVSGGLAQ
jgi:hypothetical protein